MISFIGVSVRRLLLTGVLTLCLLPCICSCGAQPKELTIASKTFTENILLAEMYAQLIEYHTGLEVRRNYALGSTPVCYTAMQNREIDMYFEYTGTIYSEILKLPYESGLTESEIFDIIKEEMDEKSGITVFETVGLNNTYALAMLREKAESMGIKTMSDLSAPAMKLIIAANDIYYLRFNDGYDSMTRKYTLNFKAAAKMELPELYAAAAERQVDVIVVYATDSRLKEHDMVILEDDKSFFPAYRGVPIVRNEVLSDYPELAGVIGLLTGRISSERMQELNYEADSGGRSIEDVARVFLTAEGLLGRT